MVELFSSEWMNKFAAAWNAEPALWSGLEKIGFTSVIAYGLLEEEKPRGVLIVENGKAKEGMTYDHQVLNWDLRASLEDWEKWMRKAPGLMGLGIAYTSRRLRFKVGDYGAMIKDPRMAGPFIKSFEVMGRV